MNKETVLVDTDRCVTNIGNRFDMILVACVRARELKRGHKPKVVTRSKPVVAALEEIQAGHIGRDYLKKIT